MQKRSLQNNNSNNFIHRIFHRGEVGKNSSHFKKLHILFLLMSFIIFYIVGFQLMGQTSIQEGQVTVKGLTLSLEPMSQIVPVNTATVVNTEFSIETPQVLKGMVVKGELKGPGLTSPISLSTLPNHPFSIPGLPRKGDYYLENIRLEREGEVLLTAEDNVLIQAMDLVVTQVESRPLSLKEIREKGINITDENFSVYHFSVGLLLKSEEVKYEFPVVYSGKDPYIPKISGGGSGGSGGVGLPAPQTIPFEMESAATVDIIDTGEQGVPTPKMTGILVFNNDIAFLNQFFSVMFIISNSAPDGSQLTLKDITASITFPDGLREAEASPPHIPGTAIPVRCPGPDKKLGTSDDLTVIMAGFSGMAEFLAEGLEEGTHYVTIDFSGTLSGLPSGDTPVKGKATGAVVVKNPEFSITFSHPHVVRIGEEYDIFVTMTNTSPVAANLVTLTMPTSRVINCKLIGDDTISFDTIPAGGSETVKFHMESIQNGEVRASAFEAEGGVTGQIILTAGVGEEGIPLSPDTLVLPSYCYKLPNDLLNALVISLGEAYSIATTPPSGVPSNLPLISRDTVKERIVEVTEAGQRVQYGETLLKSVQVLALDWLGNRTPNLAFDILRRMTTKGTKCSKQMAAIFNQELYTYSPEVFQHTFAETCHYKKPFISAVLSFNGGPRTARLEIEDFYQNILNSPIEDDEELIREIPYGELIQMEDAGQNPVDFALIGNLEYIKDEESGVSELDDSKIYTFKVIGIEDGTFDLSLILPDKEGNLKQISFSDIPCQKGSNSFTTEYDYINTNLTLKSDIDGDGIVDNNYTGSVSIVSNPSLKLIGAYQDCTVDKAGRALALFFNRSVSSESAKPIDNYTVEKKKVYAAFLQRSERVVILGLDSAISPFVDRTVTVENLEDTRGMTMLPASQEKTMVATIETPGGVVYGRILTASGTEVPNAQIRLGENESNRGLVNSYTRSDEDGNYQFDFVRILENSFQIEVYDGTITKRTEKITSRLRLDGQKLNIDIFMRGYGNVSGRVRFAGGAPPGFTETHYISVVAFVENDSNYCYDYVKLNKDSGFTYMFNIPVGTVNLKAHSYCNDNTYIGYNGVVINRDGEYRTGVDIDLFAMPTGTVKGRVLLSDGTTGVNDAVVYLERNGKPLDSPQGTGDGGKFYFENISLGPITLTVTFLNGDINLAAPSYSGELTEEGEILNAIIMLRGTANISGTVLDYDGTHLPGVVLFVDNTNIVCNSDENGNFLLPNVPVGGQTVVAYIPNTNRNVRSHIDLNVEGQDATMNVVFPAPVQTGSIRGTVYDVDGSPLSGVEVRIYDDNLLYKKYTDSDGSGNFQVDDLPVGRYFLVVNENGVGSGINQAAIQYAGYIAEADINLRGQGTLNINVYGSDGASGVMTSLEVNIPVFREIQGGKLGFYTEKRYLETDENGKRTLLDVFMGKYYVKAWNGFYPQGVYKSGTLSTNGEVVDVELVMTPPGEVTVQVVSYDGETVVPQAPIKFSANSLPAQNAVTDPTTGQYTFTLVPVGRFTVEASHPTEIYVGRATGYVPTAGGHVDITVRLKGRGTVNVAVKNLSEQVVPNAKVSLRNIQYPNERILDKVCDSNGEYSFYNISEGEFVINAFDVVSSLGGRARGTVESHGDIVNVTLYLEASGSITGYVLQPDELKITQNAQVILYNQANNEPFGYTTTDSEGSFLFEHVPHGSYRLEAYEPAAGRTGKASAEIQSEGEIDEVNIRLEGRGSIFGYVKDGGLEEIPFAYIKLETEGHFPVTLNTSADQNGYYSFEDINEGPFTIKASDLSSKLWGKASSSIDYDGHDVSLNIQTQGTGTVTGYVYESSDTPVENDVHIKISNSDKETDTTETGHYELKGIPFGTFTLTADKKNGNNHGSTTGSLSYHGETINKDIYLEGVGTVTVSVEDSTGNPKPNYNIELTNDGRTYGASSGDTGSYSFTDICKGPFSVIAFDPTEPNGLKAAADGNVETDGQVVSVTLTLEAAGQVQGRVLSSDDNITPVKDVYVRIKGDNVNLFTQTDENGEFSFNAVRLGTFELNVLGSVDVGLAKRSVTIDSAGDIVDLGDIIPDKVKPEVVTITPDTANANVGLDATVTIEFSEAMDPTTLTTGNIRLLKNGSAVSGSLSIASDNQSITFTPSSQLVGLTLYTIMISNDITDSEGNPLKEAKSSTFTTADYIPPYIVSIDPLNNSEEVLTGTAITVGFNEYINQSSVNITVSTGGVPISGTLDFPSDLSVRFIPVATLEENSLYTVEVRDVQDLMGNVQTEIFTSSFSTVDTIAPTLSLSSQSGSTSVVEGSSVTVNADIGGATDINNVFFFLDGHLSYTDNASPYSYQFTAPLIADVGNTFIVDAYVVDLVGNQSTREYLQFTLVPDSSPQITLSGPASSTVYPGSIVNFTVSASDDIALTEITFSAVGGTLNQVETSTISQASYTSTYSVTIPSDIPIPCTIAVNAEVKDTRSHVGTAPPLSLNVPSDVEDPTVTIQSPTEGASFEHENLINISATASDDVGLKEVRFYLDDQLLTTLNQEPFSTIYTVPPLSEDKNSTVKVEVEDLVGKISDATVNIVLKQLVDLEDPMVKILSPSNGSQVYAGEVVKIKVEATDDGCLVSLDLSVDGQLLQSLTESPFEAEYTVPSDAVVGSTITIEAVAHDFYEKTDTAQSVVEVVSGTILPDGTVIEADDTSYDNQTIIINDGTVTINGSHTFANVLVKESGTLNHSAATTTAEYKLEMTITGKLSVGEAAQINTNECGYLGGFCGESNSRAGYTLGNTKYGGSLLNSGGSYGGWGGQVDSIYVTNNVNMIYGSFSDPNNPGSGGGGSSDSDNDLGGRGGGVIRVISSEAVIDGLICTNGGEAEYGGGGSGGTVKIETGILRGSGSINANGGNCSERAAGGGGRIAIYYGAASEFNLDNITAYGGSYTGDPDSHQNGGSGTVYLQEINQEAQLIIDNNMVKSEKRNIFPQIGLGTITALTPTQLTDDNNAFMEDSLIGMELIPDMENKEQTFTIIDNTTHTITVDSADGDLTLVSAVGSTYGGMAVFDDHLIIRDTTYSYIDGEARLGNLSVLSGAHLGHSKATIYDEYYMSLQVAEKIIVDSESSIETYGSGYLGGGRDDNESATGFTLGNTSEDGSTGGSGGSYGGKGGESNSYYVNKIYGSIYNPINPGSGGGSPSTSYSAGSGGGVIRLSCTELINDGQINANGLYNYDSGAGSGGSIKIITGILRGSGSISSNGGDSGLRAGGGGGRIAIYYEDASGFNLDNITAYGGSYTGGTDSARNGSAGTIYLEKQGETGVIIVDNNMQESDGGTPMLGGTSGTITALEANKLVDSNADFIPGSLIGMKVIPNTNQTESFSIISNTQTEIYTDPIDGDMTLVASVGDRYGFKYSGSVILDGSQTKLSGSYCFSEITLLNSTMQIDGNLEVDSLTLQNGSKVTHPANTTTTVYSLKINANDIVIDGSSSIDVTNCGYIGAKRGDNSGYKGYTLGNTDDGGSYYNSGASYGGWGGEYESHTVNEIYGSISNPSHPGSGGGSSTGDNPAGSGGGVIRIISTEIVNDGYISANGYSAKSGGGSGGSIKIETGTLGGSGFITAKGGNSSGRAAGGGGRIAVYYDDASGFNLDNITTYGGLFTYETDSSKNGGAGTVYLKQTGQEAQLIIDNNTVKSDKRRIFPLIGPGTITTLTSTVLTDSSASFMEDSLIGMELIPDLENKEQTFTIVDNTKTTITIDSADGDLTLVSTIGSTYGGMAVYDGHLKIRNNTYSNIDGDAQIRNLSILSNSRLWHSPATTSREYYMSLNVTEKLIIEAGSYIDTCNCGYLGALRGDNDEYYGYTLGNTFTDGSYIGSGGSYGGKGGGYNGNAVNESYGSLYDPIHPGSGGGSNSSYRPAGSGGGVIRIISSEIINDGQISVNGRYGNYAGAGSGGSIKIITGTLSGSGSISANGGSSYNCAAGGGGRIAVFYEDASGFNLDNITAYGGFCTNDTDSTKNGGAGTVYLKQSTATFGDLIINNNNVSCLANTTPIPAVGQGFNTLLETNHLVDSTAPFIVDSLKGIKLNPQPSVNTLFTIISNTGTDIYTDSADGDMTLVGAIGGSYIGEHLFYNVTVKGVAQVFTTDRLQVSGILNVETGSSLTAENIQ